MTDTARTAYRALERPAPTGMSGSYTHGYAPLANVFADSVQRGEEIGAALTVYHRGVCVVDLWAGHADLAARTPWTRDTRAVVFSVTKGLAAMALTMLGDRGVLDWERPVADRWPAFGAAGKSKITLRTLFNHRAGLPALEAPLTPDDATGEDGVPRLDEAAGAVPPLWHPGEDQGRTRTHEGL